MFDGLIRFIREQYGTKEFIPLHAPVFVGNEQDYVRQTIESTFVSSVGAYVDRFENDIARYTGSPGAVATVNGTAALHIALKLAGVQANDLVITQPLSFVATCNAIAYCNAEPVFVDVDRSTLGLSPTALSDWLAEHAHIEGESCVTNDDHKIIRACVPMHTFGHPADLDRLQAICDQWRLILVEDAAESLGSTYKGRHTGTFGKLGALSFNGNKILTTGGGGMILADHELAARAKYLTTTAKKPHPYEYVHEETGYNYRLPNINAALGCAQLEQIDHFIACKRELATRYAEHFQGSDLLFVLEPRDCQSNYWLNAVVCQDGKQREALIKATNDNQIMTRPAWMLMNHLPMYAGSRSGPLNNAEFLAERLVNLPSSVLPEFYL